MPTFTGVCSWDELNGKLTELTNSTGYSSGSITSTSGALRLTTRNNFYDSWSPSWVSPDRILFIRMVGNSEQNYDYGYVYGWDGSSWIELAKRSGTYDVWIDVSDLVITQIKTRLTTDASNIWSPTYVDVPEVVVGSPDVLFGIGSDSGVMYKVDSGHLMVNCIPYTSINMSWPVQYLLKVEPGYIILAVQGVYQVDSSARTHLVYIGKLDTPPGTPPAYAAATTMGSANLTAILSDNRRTEGISSYSVGTGWNVPAMNIDSDILLSPLYVYRSDEGWRGRFRSLYVANLTPGSLLNGETVTAPDGSKYTFFNIPASQDGYYNNFLASGATNQWLVVKH